MNNTKEIWKIIEDYPDYMVSNKGRVKSMARIVNYSNGGGEHLLEDIIMKGRINNMGYWQISLFKNKKPKTKTIHRLMGIAFVPNPKNNPEINHINGIKHDNRIENLEWTTRSGNATHACKIGLMGKEETHPMATINNGEVLAIKQLLRYSKISKVKIGEMFGTSNYVIDKINNGKNWLSIQL